jgi:hypothetical protein
MTLYRMGAEQLRKRDDEMRLAQSPEFART